MIYIKYPTSPLFFFLTKPSRIVMWHIVVSCSHLSKRRFYHIVLHETRTWVIFWISNLRVTIPNNYSSSDQTGQFLMLDYCFNGTCMYPDAINPSVFRFNVGYFISKPTKLNSSLLKSTSLPLWNYTFITQDVVSKLNNPRHFALMWSYRSHAHICFYLLQISTSSYISMHISFCKNHLKSHVKSTTLFPTMFSHKNK